MYGMKMKLEMEIEMMMYEMDMEIALDREKIVEEEKMGWVEMMRKVGGGDS